MMFILWGVCVIKNDLCTTKDVCATVEEWPLGPRDSLNDVGL
jgi:hypothetical protein